MEFNVVSFVVGIVSFGLLYFLLNRYAFGPLFSIMEQRRQHVMNELQTAEQNRASSVQYLEEQKQAMETARQEAYGIVEQARQASSRQSEEMINAARAESNRLKEEALKDIESEKNKAVAALRSQVSAMSVMIASKIIEKQVDEKTQQQLVDQYLNEVGDSK